MQQLRHSVRTLPTQAMLLARRCCEMLGNVVYPRECAVCGVSIDPDEATWCQPCAMKIITANSQECCTRCGMSVGPYIASAKGCPNCIRQPWPTEAVCRVGPYHTQVGELIKRFKYGRCEYLDRPLGVMLSSRLVQQPWCGKIDGLVPVPATWRSRWKYGFSPAGALTRVVGRECDLPVLPVVAVKGKRDPQVGLNAEERAANVRGVFRIRRRSRVEGATLCIIDDVATTGATLREVTRVLKQAGAAVVYGAVVARAGHRNGDSMEV